VPGERPIVGGAPSDAAEVMALRVRAACGQPAMFACSAVRVSPRALVTAAHCVRDTPAGLFEIVREPDALDPGAIPIAVASVRFAPGEVDLAVIATTERMPAPFAPPGAVPADPAGATVTIVGYGSDGDDTGGLRRAGTATIAAFDAATLTLAPGPAITCGGDSGGPVLLGGELVAITSFGDPACTASTTAVRIDASRAFIDDAVVTAGLLPEDQPAAGEADCGVPEGCCSTSASPDLGLLAIVVLVLVAVACGKSSKPGPCGSGRQHGDAPPKGTAMWCTDAAGAKEGAYTEWWPSGPKKVETSYRKGRQHGAFASWHENGKPNEAGTLTDGLRSGHWKEHYEDGAIKRESDYGAGGGGYRWTLYREEDGTRWMEGGFKGQREHGRFVEWYPDGKKLAEGDFVDGARTSTWSYWNADGSASATELGAFASGSFNAAGGAGDP
jgi:hypothetical protein